MYRPALPASTLGDHAAHPHPARFVTLVLGTARRRPTRLAAWIAHDTAYGRFELWLPVLAAAGIGLAVAAPVSFSPYALGAATAALVIARAILGRTPLAALAPVALGLAAVAAGAFGLAAQERWAGTPVLLAPVTATVDGTVVAVARRGPGRQSVVLGDLSGLAAPVPYRIRLSVRGGGRLPVGARVSARARLFPLAGPDLPGGYDPARRAYFDRIGATGFTFGAPAVLAPPAGAAAATVDRVRTAVEARIVATVPDGNAGFAAALLVGLDGLMPPADVEALRVSGLAHVLSISGLHMVLVAGTVFATVRFALALVPRLALALPIRKFAAVAGLLAATLYLAVSGGNVATVRAWVMFVVALVAILADRPALSLRTVAFAAVVCMALDPIAVAEPSFQMSFAAVVALVAAFEWWTGRPKRHPPVPVLSFVAGLAVTSLVAGLATAPASAFHFHRLPPLGLVANLAAMPVMSFVTMPAGVLALALMPFGLEHWPLVVMDASLSVVVAIAHHVADWSGDAGATGAIPLASALLAMGGLLWLAIFTAPWRLAGAGAIAAALAIAPLAPHPDLFVSADGGTVAARGADGRLAVLGSNAFAAEQWLEADADLRPPKKAAGGRCDTLGCTLPLAAGAVAVPRTPRALAEDCALAAAVVSTETVAGCTAPLVVDRDALVAHGAIAATRAGDGWRVRHARPDGNVRPWHVAPTPDLE